MGQAPVGEWTDYVLSQTPSSDLFPQDTRICSPETLHFMVIHDLCDLFI